MAFWYQSCYYGSISIIGRIVALGHMRAGMQHIRERWILSKEVMKGKRHAENVASDGIMTSDVMTMNDSCNSGTFRECYDIQTDADLPEKMLHCHSFALVDLSAAIMETKL